MSSNDQKVGKILSLVGDFAAGLGSVIGGEASFALLGVGAVTKGVAKLIGAGKSVDEVLSHMRALPTLTKPWREPITSEDTQPETPSAKKGG